jgi:hypothetical protein
MGEFDNKLFTGTVFPLFLARRLLYTGRKLGGITSALPSCPSRNGPFVRYLRRVNGFFSA